jgi:hypothetical protein
VTNSNSLPWKAPAKIAYTSMSPLLLRSARNGATNERCEISHTALSATTLDFVRVFL